jgi:hypothetical protein
MVFRWASVAHGAGDSAPPASSSACTEGLSVVLSQIVVQRSRAGFFQERLEHHVLATTFGETEAVFFLKIAFVAGIVTTGTNASLTLPLY